MVINRAISAALTGSLLLNVWGIIRLCQSPKTTPDGEHFQALKLSSVVNLRKKTAPAGDREEKYRKDEQNHAPKSGHVWCNPGVLASFIGLRSTGVPTISREFKGILRLNEEQTASFEGLVQQAITTILSKERETAELIETPEESYIRIPGLASDPALSLIKAVKPPLEADQLQLLDSVLHASPWFQGVTETRTLALEQEADGAYYFTWRNSQYRLNDALANSNRGPWAEFSDRFGHLVNLPALVTATKKSE